MVVVGAALKRRAGGETGARLAYIWECSMSSSEPAGRQICSAVCTYHSFSTFTILTTSAIKDQREELGECKIPKFRGCPLLTIAAAPQYSPNEFPMFLSRICEGNLLA